MLTKYLSLARPISILTVLPLAMTLAASIGLSQKRCRIIYNPTSGREALKNDLVEILNILERAGYETSAFATTPEPNSAQNEAKRAAQAGFNLY